MMELFISKYCVLNNRQLSVNGEMVYENRQGATDSEFLSAAYRRFGMGYPKFFKMDHLSKTGFIVTEMLLKDTALFGVEPKRETAVVFSNRNSSLDTDENYQETIGKDYFPSPSVFVYTLPNIVMGEVCIKHKIFGENTFFVSDELEVEHIFTYVNQLFEQTETENALVGWVDYYDGKAEALVWLVEKQKGIKLFNITELYNLKSFL